MSVFSITEVKGRKCLVITVLLAINFIVVYFYFLFSPFVNVPIFYSVCLCIFVVVYLCTS